MNCPNCEDIIPDEAVKKKATEQSRFKCSNCSANLFAYYSTEQHLEKKFPTVANVDLLNLTIQSRTCSSKVACFN